MIRIVAIIIVSFCLMFMPSAQAAEVEQGKCLKLDRVAFILVIEEYDIDFSPRRPYGNATGKISTFDISKASMDISVQIGDVLRIAYDLGAKCKIAIKVMNVTRQSEK